MRCTKIPIGEGFKIEKEICFDILLILLRFWMYFEYAYNLQVS